MKIKQFFNKIKNIFKINFYNVQLENPISKSNEDIVGFETEVKRLSNAIKQGANNIAIISTFGSGKSTLVELLKHKLSKCLLNFKYKVVKINLWDEELSEFTFLEEKKELDSIDEKQIEEKNKKCSLPIKPSRSSNIKLHKTFLKQLSLQTKKYRQEYVNKRINLNYGAAKISFPNYKTLFFWAILFFIIVSIIVYIIGRFFLGIESIDSILYIDKIKIIKKFIELLPLIGTTFIIFFIIFNREVMFSFWNTSKNREITEEDTVALYNELISKHASFGRKLIIVVEDLDRIENKNLVINYINEFYRIYIEGNNQKHKKNITFIFCIKNEFLYKLDEFKECVFSKEDSKFIKMFDYICNLPTIYLNDYDEILKKMVNKDKLLKTKIQIGEIKIEELEWLAKGKNLNIRIIKNRLEMFKNIYLRLNIKNKNLLEKDNIYVNNVMCAFVSFAQSEYPKELYELLEKYDENNQNDIDVLVQKWLMQEELDEPNELNSSNEFLHRKGELKKYIIELIQNKKIDEQYRKYFYNIPKGVKIFTISQNKVASYILETYIPKISDYNEFDVLISSSDKENFIYDQLEKRINLGRGLPQMIFLNDVLFHNGQKFKEEIQILSENTFVLKEDNIDKICKFYLELKKSNINKSELAQFIKPYVESSMEFIIANNIETDILKKYRMALIDCLGDEILQLESLFETYTIYKSEINLINNCNVLLELCKYLSKERQQTIFADRFNQIVHLNDSIKHIETIIKEYKNLDLVFKIKNLDLLPLDDKKNIYEQLINEFKIKEIKLKIDILEFLRLYDEEINNFIISSLKKNLLLERRYIEYLNSTGVFDNKTIKYFLNINRLYKLKRTHYEKLKEINLDKYLIFKSYSSNRTRFIDGELLKKKKLLCESYVKYDELYEKYNSNYDVKKILFDRKVYAKLNKSNNINKKIFIFIDQTQDKNIIEFVLNNEDLTNKNKAEYISKITHIDLEASKYLYNYYEKNREEIPVIIKNSIYTNNSLFKKLDTKKRMSISKKIYYDMREMIKK